MPNWNNPEGLELYNTETHEVREVVPDRDRWPNARGYYGLAGGCGYDTYFFDYDGIAVSFSPWIIRDKQPTQEGVSPELVERMIKLVKFVEKSITHPRNREEARAILSELDKAKPDPLEEAWEEALSVYHSTHLDRGSQKDACIKRLRNVLTKRGLTITELQKEDG